MATDTTLPLFSKELILSYVFTLGAGLLALASQFLLPKEVPLWYSLAIPEAQLVPKLMLLLFPALMLFLCLTHTAVINKLRAMDGTIIKIFSYGTTLTMFLFLLSLVHIIYVFL